MIENKLKYGTLSISLSSHDQPLKNVPYYFHPDIIEQEQDVDLPYATFRKHGF